MSTLSKEGSVPSPAVPVKGSGSSSSPPSSGYIPSGVMLATICKALRDAQDNDLEMQQQQAEEEQAYYKTLGGLNGNIENGLIATVAAKTAQAGEDEADGLKTQGLSSAVNAGVVGVSGGAALVGGGMAASKSSKLDGEIEQIKNSNKELDKSPNGDLLAGAPKKQIDPELERAINEEVDPKAGKPAADAVEANKLNGDVEKLKKRNEDKQKDLEKEQERHHETIDRIININQTVGNIVQSATGAAGSYGSADSKINSAADNASAGVQKQVQDMSLSSANNYQQQATDSSQQAKQIADTLAQVAQSQVQFRG